VSTDPKTPALSLIVTIALLIAWTPHVGSRAQVPADRRPARIISLIPAVTEMLFAIGAGPRVVAVSSFDEYPPEVKSLQRVGALLDPDVERILSLRPDLVIVYGTQADLIKQLARASIPMFHYQHAGLADVARTIAALGEAVGQRREADAVVERIETDLAAVRTRVAGRDRPRTLIVFGREALALRGIYASGGVGFLHDMLEAAGGQNVFADIARQSVQASTELILVRRPEVILELRGGEMTPDIRAREAAVWNALPSLPAVRSRRVHVLNDPRTVVPGPRVAEGAALIARAVHPEAFR
jgi:iron complex transport system substrate-binding protein